MKHTNLVLVTIDSLRADCVGCLRRSTSKVPIMKQLASEGVCFTHALAHGPRSPASFPSVLASRYLSAGADKGIPPDLITLAQVLRDHGYATAGFCAGNPYISRYYGYDRGFDLFRDYCDQASGGAGSGGRQGGGARFKRRIRHLLAQKGTYDPAFQLLTEALRGKKNLALAGKEAKQDSFESGHTLNRDAVSWLAGRQGKGRPFFLWLHFMEVHYPYLPHGSGLRGRDYARFAPALGLLLAGRPALARRVIADLYGDRIGEVDGLLGELLANLRSLAVLDNTLLVVTADHGEEFLEHGGWCHAAKLYDELLRVPLILWGPGLPAARVVRGPVGLIDLGPTVLDLLAVGKPPTFQGASWLPWLRDGEAEPAESWVLSEAVHLGNRQPLLWKQDVAGRRTYWIRSCRDSRWKYICDEEGSKEELYDLVSDAAETENLAARLPEVTGRMRSMLHERLATLASSGPGPTPQAAEPLTPEEDAEIARRLRALGYF